MSQDNKRIGTAFQLHDSIRAPVKIAKSAFTLICFDFLSNIQTWSSSALLNDSSHSRHLCLRRISWNARMWPSNASWFGASKPHSWHRFGSIEWHLRCNFKRYRLLNQSPQIVHISLLFSSFFARFCGSSEWCVWICFWRWLFCKNPRPQMSHTIRAPVVFP